MRVLPIALVAAGLMTSAAGPASAQWLDHNGGHAYSGHGYARHAQSYGHGGNGYGHGGHAQQGHYSGGYGHGGYRGDAGHEAH